MDELIPLNAGHTRLTRALASALYLATRAFSLLPAALAASPELLSRTTRLPASLHLGVSRTPEVLVSRVHVSAPSAKDRSLS